MTLRVLIISPFGSVIVNHTQHQPQSPSLSHPPCESYYLGVVVGALRSFGVSSGHSAISSGAENAGSAVLELEIAGNVVFVHDGSRDETCSVFVDDANERMGYMTAIIYPLTSNPVTATSHNKLAQEIGRAFAEHFKSTLLTMIQTEITLRDENVNNSNVRSLLNEEFETDPDTREEFVGFLEEIVVPFVNRGDRGGSGGGGDDWDAEEIENMEEIGIEM